MICEGFQKTVLNEFCVCMENLQTYVDNVNQKMQRVATALKGVLPCQDAEADVLGKSRKEPPAVKYRMSTCYTSFRWGTPAYPFAGEMLNG
jgi:hypothetical protein